MSSKDFGAFSYLQNPSAAIHSAHNPMTSTPISVPDGVQHFVSRLSDPGEFTNAVAGATLKVDFLAPQQTMARIERFAGEGWAIDSYDAGVKARLCGPLLPRQVAVCLVLRSGVFREYGVDVDEGYLLCNPPGVPIDGYLAPGFLAMSASIPVELWEECRLVSGCVLERMEGFQAIPLPPKVFRELREKYMATRLCLLGWEPNCAAHAIMGARLARDLAVAAWEHIGRQRPIEGSSRNRFRLARRAETWMREHMGESFSIPEICLALGVSRRELEYAFQTAFGESPRDFLESLRMNAVRKALRQAEYKASVTEIALAYGLNHLGRFSTKYRFLFGERPSETIRTVRRS
jgi:AraC family transcriptional regulator, ethanolamine operon transcriptional activator